MGSLTVVIALGIALTSVVPLNRAAVAGPKPAFDWTQFVKGVKRATEAEAAVPGTQEVDIDYQDSQFQIKPVVGAPTFMPPMVDPQYFIDKKTALLNGLFSPTGPVGAKAAAIPPFAGAAIAPNYFAGKKTAFLGTLFGRPATNTTMQRRLIAPWLTTPPPPFDPKVMADKKTAFLDKLFASFATTAPPSAWISPPPKAAVKPTIVPPDFWLPFPPSKSVVDPSVTTAKETNSTSVYDDKVVQFVEKLLEALRGPKVEGRAVPPLDARGQLEETLVGELTSLKDDMLATWTQMLASQTVPAKLGKKGFGGPWGPAAAPTADPTTPLRQKMDALSREFDMLAALQKVAATAVGEAEARPTPAPGASLLDLLREMEPAPRARSVQMAVRQGYQSLPPGTSELLTAGGGSAPHGREGGGITLQDASSTWESRHHHHHN